MNRSFNRIKKSNPSIQIINWNHRGRPRIQHLPRKTAMGRSSILREGRIDLGSPVGQRGHQSLRQWENRPQNPGSTCRLRFRMIMKGLLMRKVWSTRAIRNRTTLIIFSQEKKIWHQVLRRNMRRSRWIQIIFQRQVHILAKPQRVKTSFWTSFNAILPEIMQILDITMSMQEPILEANSILAMWIVIMVMKTKLSNPIRQRMKRWSERKTQII